jgi:hypothetical protein
MGNTHSGKLEIAKRTLLMDDGQHVIVRAHT